MRNTIDPVEREIQQANIVRLAYARHRCNDLPAVYVNLLPVTSDIKELWQAERAIRRQIEIDLKHLASPWRQIGPACTLGDTSNMTGLELIEFGCEVSIPAGMHDRPKDGRENDPEVLVEQEVEQEHAQQWVGELLAEQQRIQAEMQAALSDLNK